MILERLCDVVETGSSAVSSVDMRLASCQLIVMNIQHLLLRRHNHAGRCHYWGVFKPQLRKKSRLGVLA